MEIKVEMNMELEMYVWIVDACFAVSVALHVCANPKVNEIETQKPKERKVNSQLREECERI